MELLEYWNTGILDSLDKLSPNISPFPRSIIPLSYHSILESTPKSDILATKALRHQDLQNISY
jgi:hypothetical protein